MSVAQVFSQNLIGDFRSSSWFAWLCGSLLGKIPSSCASLQHTKPRFFDVDPTLPPKPVLAPWLVPAQSLCLYWGALGTLGDEYGRAQLILW